MTSSRPLMPNRSVNSRFGKRLTLAAALGMLLSTPKPSRAGDTSATLPVAMPPALSSEIAALNTAVAALQAAIAAQATDIAALRAEDAAVNGLGNVVIGYNEPRGGPCPGSMCDDRRGSHMLVLGTVNNYSSFGGIVAGRANTTSSPWQAATARR